MTVTQKCQYALRAMLELAKRADRGPAKVGDIAEAQRIPPRFLEVILGELKQGGFTDSRRGKVGGYFLSRPPRTITVGEVIRFVQGPLSPVESAGSNGKDAEHSVFVPLWKRAEAALSEIYDGTTFQHLVDEETNSRSRGVQDFTI